MLCVLIESSELFVSSRGHVVVYLYRNSLTWLFSHTADRLFASHGHHMQGCQ